MNFLEVTSALKTGECTPAPFVCLNKANVDLEHRFVRESKHVNQASNCPGYDNKSAKALVSEALLGARAYAQVVR